MAVQYHIHSSLTETTAPTEEPVSVSELRQQCSIDHTEDDLWLEEMGKAAREILETDAEIALLTTTFTLSLDAFPDGIELRRPPVASVSSVSYIDTAGDSQTLVEGTDYTVDLLSSPARIVPAYGTSWPATRSVPNAVTSVFVAGGTAPESVPVRAIRAIKMLVAHWYLNREAAGTVTKEIEFAFSTCVKSLHWRVGV